jgi:hypothetical protein
MWPVLLTRFQDCVPYWLEWIGNNKVDKLLNLRLGKETKGRQLEYHSMGMVIVDKKIFGLLGGIPHPCRLRVVSCWVSMSKY